MKKIVPLSLIAAASLYANEIELSSIDVESTIITEVSQKAQKSADLSQALSQSVPSIDMTRRSGISNDIFIRGQSRDNISIEVDGTKVCGACPNRMDPPVSHILANQIDSIEVTEGPYDVETFGVMSGGVKIKTKQPTQKTHAEVNLGYGAWNYMKVGATASGGNDVVRVLVSASAESSDQYKDGDGDTMAQQVANNATSVASNPNSSPTEIAMAKGAQYKPQYKDMKAYDKKSIMAKAFITVTDDQELRLGATANRSSDVLYPNSKMDANYDDSNIYNIEYNIKDVSDIYKNINLQYYKSDVDHPMGTDYRISSAPKDADGNPLPLKVVTNWLTTDMQGIKLKNDFDISDYKLLIGLDASQRKWDGHYEMNGNPAGGPFGSNGRKSIDDAVTENMAIFAKLDKSFGALSFSLGARYDSTDITNGGGLQNNDYTGLNANLLTTFNINKDNLIFLGVGQANRVPDARELYFRGSMNNVVGTDTLEQTTNQEIDLGYEIDNDNFMFKIKGFYSMLNDYIYIKKGVGTNAFENIDATIYGTELSASVYATDDITIDIGASYKVGEKDEALAGQTDKDLANIAPLRGNIALNWEYYNNSIASIDLRASDRWDAIDSDNGEQVLDSWSILNLKVKHAVSKNFDFTLGVNNLLDETYALSNTYADLILVTAGGSGDVMLMNEPGRYIYTNIDFRF
ncbi:MAG: TonB-dependent receptor [Campylobacterota bacterium]|nr:TonB-dependent receptor [Campylobacterota bacterium]